jgi:aminoglycoside phosphotransferase family enzyme/predicted kinase
MTGSRHQTSQDDVIAFLAAAGSYGPGVDEVKRCVTHGAIVFLAGADAYKIKRAVRYPYMDLSTLAARADMCRREVAVNARFAPELYLGVVPIVRRADGGLQLGGDGEPVEWAVHMRRFPGGALISEMLARGTLTDTMLDLVGDAVARSHDHAPVVTSADPVARLTRDAANSVGVLASDADLARRAQSFATLFAAELARRGALIQSRAAAGHVRRCHGDLHLANVIVSDGRAVLFDAIEFDDDIATVDILSDLSFLIMDLIAKGRADAANAVLNRYLWRRQQDSDLAGLGLLPLLIADRAGIRAMVALQRGRANGDARADVAEAAAYLDIALAALSPREPSIVAIGGLSGSGKSTLAKALAAGVGPWPGAVVLRSDLERKALHGREPHERLGPEDYTAAASERVYQVLMEKARKVAAAGHAVIVDAVFGQAGERAAVADVAATTGLRFHGLWLKAPADFLFERVKRRTGDASDANADVIAGQLARQGDARSEWTEIETIGGMTATATTARAILAT